MPAIVQNFKGVSSVKMYSAGSSDVYSVLAHMQQEFHPTILDATIKILFVFDDEETSLQVLRHAGYLAAAVVRITPTKQRALGVSDAVIIVDRACWLAMSAPQRDALIDHELQHLDRCMTEPTEEDPKAHPAFDKLGRPRLRMRAHDHQFGWFDDIAQRHGEHSGEVRQAKELVASSSQLYFDFPPQGAVTNVVNILGGGRPLREVSRAAVDPVVLTNERNVTDAEIVEQLARWGFDVRPPIWSRMVTETQKDARMYYYDRCDDDDVSPPDSLLPYAFAAQA